jgi:hypothetical protein
MLRPTHRLVHDTVHFAEPPERALAALLIRPSGGTPRGPSFADESEFDLAGSSLFDLHTPAA